MIYLCGDKIAQNLEPLLKNGGFLYTSYVDSIMPMDLKIADNDTIIFIGTKKQHDLMPSSYKTKTIFLSKIGLTLEKLEEVISKLASVTSLVVSKDTIDEEGFKEILSHTKEMIEFKLGDSLVRLIPNNMLPKKDGPIEISLGSFLLVNQLLLKVDNISKCTIKLTDA